MFEGSLIESTGAVRLQSRWPAFASLAAQAAVAAALLALPMLRPDTLLPRTFALPLAPPPHPPAPRPLPRPIQHIRLSNAAAPSAPSAPATGAAVITAHPPLAPEPGDGDIMPSVTGLNLAAAGPGMSALGSVIGSGSGHPNVAVGAPSHGPVNVSRGVSVGLLLAPIRAEYPSIARAARIQGTVEVHATISASGRVEHAEAVSGPDMLRGAALEAVRAAQYRPYLLNGQPTEVSASFTIHFNLNS